MPGQVRRVQTVIDRLDQHDRETPPEPEPAPRHVASLLPAAARPPPSAVTCRRNHACSRPADQRRGRRWQRLAGWRVRSASWAAVVPVKRLAAAKSRLRGAVPGAAHEELALAMAARHRRGGAGLRRRSAEVAGGHRRSGGGGRAWPRWAPAAVPDRPGAGLNAALRLRRRPWSAGRRRWPRSPATCRRCARPSWARAAGAQRRRPAARLRRRTPPAPAPCCSTAPPGVPLDPRFGPGSAAAHAASGAVAARRRLAGAAPGRRHRRRSGRGAGPRARPAHLRAARDLGSSPMLASVIACGTVATSTRHPVRHGAARRRHASWRSRPRRSTLRAAAAAAGPAGTLELAIPTGGVIAGSRSPPMRLSQRVRPCIVPLTRTGHDERVTQLPGTDQSIRAAVGSRRQRGR